MRRRALAPVLALVGVVAAGCVGGNGGGNGGGIDAACDAAGIQETITGIVNEAALQFGEFEELACTGDWAFARASIEGDGGSSQPFVFMRQGDEWILKAPEIVCGTVGADPAARPADAEVPADIWPAACAGLTVAE